MGRAHTVICDSKGPSAQSDPGLQCPLTDSLDTIECINREQIPGRDYAHVWNESESVYFAHARRLIFAWSDSYIFVEK